MAPHLKGKISLNSKEARDAVRGLERSVNKFKKNVGAPLGKIAKMAGVAGLALSAMSAKAITSVAKAGDAMDKMSKRTGIGTAELSRYAHAAALSGGSIDGMEKSLKSMGTALYEAQRGTKTYTDALGGLGLSFQDLENLDPSGRFDLILSSLADVEDASIRSALALKVFGRNGIQLLPMLSDGAAGLKAMKAEADRLGIVFSTDQAVSAARLVDEVTRLKAAFKGLFIQGLELDSVSDSIEGLTGSIIQLRDSGAMQQITTGMISMASKGIAAINALIGGFNKMTDAEKDAVKNAGIAFVAVSVAFKSGLLIPIMRGMAVLVASVATASATIATILSGLGAFIAGYNIGAILDSKFSIGGWLAKNEIEGRLVNAKLRDRIKLEGLAPSDVGVIPYNEAMKETEPVDFLELWLKNQSNNNNAAALEAKGKSMADHLIAGIKNGAQRFTPDDFKNLFSGMGKIFDIEIPDLAELTKTAALKSDLTNAEESMKNIAALAAPIRGFMTGGLSINHALGSQATNTEKREGDKSQTAKAQLTEQKKSNELLYEVVSGIQARGSFSFVF